MCFIHTSATIIQCITQVSMAFLETPQFGCGVQ